MHTLSMNSVKELILAREYFLDKLSQVLFNSFFLFSWPMLSGYYMNVFVKMLDIVWVCISRWLSCCQFHPFSVGTSQSTARFDSLMWISAWILYLQSVAFHLLREITARQGNSRATKHDEKITLPFIVRSLDSNSMKHEFSSKKV